MKNLSKIISAIFLLAVGASQGSTIFWGTPQNTGLADPSIYIINSQGNLLDASYSFEIGTFATGFTPDSTNLDQWELNWIVFDKVSNGSGWNPGNQEVAGTVDHTTTSGSSSPFATPGGVFPQGVPAYLWVYNTKNMSLTPEWALLEDVDNGSNTYAAWEFPDPALTLDSFDWQVKDVDTPIYGGVNNVRGAGDFAVQPAAFAIQTAAVPEPGSILLLGLGSFMAFRRSRRQVSPKN
jgi:hypothetical protein